MAIVSMATESYVNWLHHFLKSLEDTIPEEKKIIFLINVEIKTINKLKKKFLNVQFISEKKQVAVKEGGVNGVFKVTYLKGEFMEKAYVRLGEPLLWIDCTALIKKSPGYLLDKLEKLDVLLMRRDFKKDFGKSVYACEIFGMNNIETIKEYKANCEKRKTEWFADQLALCEIQTNKRDHIEFGKWSNFYYDEEANSWSDRGKTGNGILNEGDYNFTELKFIDNLEKRFPGYEISYEEFFNKQKSKQKVLVHIDDFQWCYHTTIKQVTERLKDKYDFLIIEDAKKDYTKYKNWKGDLVWARCSSKRHKKLLEFRPDLKKISFSTVTTGGETGEDRVTAQLQSNKGEAGIICQNKDVGFRLQYKLKKLGRNQDVYLLHNGVDTEKFKPKSMTSKKSMTPVVGFVGRTRTYPEDFMKGYSTILKPVCEELGLELKGATNETGKVQDFKDMPEFYRKIDLLVLLSHSEGHSNTINEAMASGIPIVAFPTGWHYEKAQGQGIIWCQRNTIELLEILSDFKSNFKNYESLGQKNREFAVRELSWDVVANYYDDTIKKMIRSAKLYNPSIENGIDKNIYGTIQIEYVAEDNGINSPYGVFKRGKKYKVSPEAYNYFRQNFPNKFKFQENE